MRSLAYRRVRQDATAPDGKILIRVPSTIAVGEPDSLAVVAADLGRRADAAHRVDRGHGLLALHRQQQSGHRGGDAELAGGPQKCPTLVRRLNLVLTVVYLFHSKTPLFKQISTPIVNNYTFFTL